MANSLGLRRLHDYLQGSTTLTDELVWLLGKKYDLSQNTDQAKEDLLADFMSLIWCTYRNGFEKIGEQGLASDVGWGCMIRSGQMLLANCIMRHTVGQHSQLNYQSLEPQQRQVFSWIYDGPGEEHPFSFHSICSAGKNHGIQIGCWLGPYAWSSSAVALIQQHLPPQLQGKLGAMLVGQGGGGAPYLDKRQLLANFDQAKEGFGLLVLVPMMLGVEKIDPRYVEQLRAIFTYPQCMGIAGGRPQSSLYFIGTQGDTVFYLDPHAVQPVVSSDAELVSYQCTTLRHMPLASIDPSLALGFYCRGKDSALDLLQRLDQLTQLADGAPLVTLTKPASPQAQQPGTKASSADQVEEGDDWLLVDDDNDDFGEGDDGDEAQQEPVVTTQLSS